MLFYIKQSSLLPSDVIVQSLQLARGLISNVEHTTTRIQEGRCLFTSQRNVITALHLQPKDTQPEHIHVHVTCLFGAHRYEEGTHADKVFSKALYYRRHH